MKRTILSLILVVYLTGCGKFIFGTKSDLVMPSDAPNGSHMITKYDMFIDKINILEFPDISVGYKLENWIQTHESTWFGIELPMIPLQWDPENKKLYDEDMGLKTFLTLIPKTVGQLFNYKHIVLAINGENCSPAKAELYRIKNVDPEIVAKERGKYIEMESYALSYINHEYTFKILYDVSTPSPDNDITVDLSNALELPSDFELPILKFEKQIWSRTKS